MPIGQKQQEDRKKKEEHNNTPDRTHDVQRMREVTLPHFYFHTPPAGSPSSDKLPFLRELAIIRALLAGQDQQFPS